MKAIKIISVFLVLATLCCVFASCNNKDEYIELPDRPFYERTVSFQIIDQTKKGKVLVDAVDYQYKGHEEPTILNIISDYLVIELEYKCTIDEDDNTLVSVGGTKAKKGQYWAFMDGIHDNETFISSEYIDLLINSKMYDYIIEDGEEFTVVLTTIKD